jgi:hypothetical protein
MLALDSCFLLLQTIYVFGFSVPLFIDADQGTGGKWGLWILHKLVLTGVYGVIVFMYHSRWRDRLPGNWLHFRCIILYASSSAGMHVTVLPIPQKELNYHKMNH